MAKKKKENFKNGFVEATPEEYKKLIEKAAEDHGISTATLSALLQKESNFNPNAVNPNSGASGIAQFMPETAKSLGIDPFNVEEAIDGTAKYLSSLIKRFGSVEKGLAAYNAGPGNVEKYEGIPPFEETQNYVKDILGKSGEVIKAFVPTPTPIDEKDPIQTVLGDRAKLKPERGFGEMLGDIISPSHRYERMASPIPKESLVNQELPLMKVPVREEAMEELRKALQKRFGFLN